jgi:hypothetical protein
MYAFLRPIAYRIQSDVKSAHTDAALQQEKSNLISMLVQLKNIVREITTESEALGISIETVESKKIQDCLQAEMRAATPEKQEAEEALAKIIQLVTLEKRIRAISVLTGLTHEIILACTLVATTQFLSNLLVYGKRVEICTLEKLLQDQSEIEKHFSSMDQKSSQLSRDFCHELMHQLGDVKVRAEMSPHVFAAISAIVTEVSAPKSSKVSANDKVRAGVDKLQKSLDLPYRDAIEKALRRTAKKNQPAKPLVVSQIKSGLFKGKKAAPKEPPKKPKRPNP